MTKSSRAKQKAAPPRLTLDGLATYQIRVPGHLEAGWAEWANSMTLTTDVDALDGPVTTLTGPVDQAALLGLLRRLYSLGLPLISVLCLDAR